MAIIEYYGAMPSDMAVTAGAGRLLEYDDDSAVIASLLNPDTILFRGINFQYADSKLVGGIINEIVYQTSYGEHYRMTDIQYDLSLGVPFFGGSDLLAGADIVLGSYRGDYLYGWDGGDVISGRQGEDYIRGGEGNDTLRGGGKSDTFFFAKGDGFDRIVDFDALGWNRDCLVFRLGDDTKRFEQLDVSERHGNLIIELGSEQEIMLRDIDLDDLSAGNFVFV